MAKIRRKIGTDFPVTWIPRDENGDPVDFTGAMEMQVFIVQRYGLRRKLPQEYRIVDNAIIVDFIASEQKEVGIYDLYAKWKRVDETIEGGIKNFLLYEPMAIELIPRDSALSEEDGLNEEITSTIASMMRGEPFTYDDFTPEQLAELKQPAIEAAETANAAAELAEEKAEAANTAAQNAQQVADDYAASLASKAAHGYGEGEGVKTLKQVDEAQDLLLPVAELDSRMHTIVVRSQDSFIAALEDDTRPVKLILIDGEPSFFIFGDTTINVRGVNHVVGSIDLYLESNVTLTFKGRVTHDTWLYFTGENSALSFNAGSGCKLEVKSDLYFTITRYKIYGGNLNLGGAIRYHVKEAGSYDFVGGNLAHVDLHALKNHAHDGRYYTENEVDAKLDDKADKATTYSKDDVNAALGSKADLVGGKIPAAQLPSFVDDVLEFASKEDFPTPGEAGKIYIAKDTNKTYRWGGSAYVEISESLALGDVTGTAYDGAKGKALETSKADKANTVTAVSGSMSAGGAGTAFTLKQTKNGAQSTVGEIPFAAKIDDVWYAGIPNGLLLKKIDEIEEGANKTTVTDNLTSGSSTEALSAKQGKELKEKFDSIEFLVKSDRWYGVEWNDNDADSALARIGNLDLHRQLPIQNRMKRCLLRDDGTINYYLDEDDSTLKEDGVTPSDLTGADGMVQVEIPEMYLKREDKGADHRIMISEEAIPGFEFVDKQYIGAYKAALDRTDSSNLKLASVVNATPEFRGGNNQADWDGTYKSMLGMPATAISLINSRQYARNRGNAGLNGAGWNCNLYHAAKIRNYLYFIEYADRNCQLPFNPELTAQGFKQGGLGNGVTTISGANWIDYNGYYPLVPCGVTNQLGNKTGVVSHATEGNGITHTFDVPCYRGIESPFGDLWEWTDGALLKFNSDELGGEFEVYACDDPSLFHTTDFGRYRKVGVLPETSGWVKSLIDGEILPRTVGGSSTTWFSDYFNFWAEKPTSGFIVRGVLLSAAAYSGIYAGLSPTSVVHVLSYTNSYIGSRLCFLPETR